MVLVNATKPELMTKLAASYRFFFLLQKQEKKTFQTTFFNTFNIDCVTNRRELCRYISLCFPIIHIRANSHKTTFEFIPFENSVVAGWNSASALSYFSWGYYSSWMAQSIRFIWKIAHFLNAKLHGTDFWIVGIHFSMHRFAMNFTWTWYALWCRQ